MFVSGFPLCLTRVAAAVAIGGSIGMALASSVAQAAVVPPGVQLAAKQELTRGNGGEVETLDPTKQESNAANNVTRDLFEGLTNIAGPDNKVVPGVAQSWELKDPTTWIFHLRKNAKWSNGEPVVANDFVYGAQRLVDPKTASAYADTYGVFLLNGADIVAGKKPVTSLGVRAIDAYTLEIKTPYPVPFMPELVSNSNLCPVNKADVDKYGADWAKPGKLVGNGAFVLKDWQVNNKIVLVKNPQYWDAANVQLTQVTYLPIEDENVDLQMYQSGGDDWTLSLPAGSYGSIKQKYPNEVRNTALLDLTYTTLNNNDPLLKDVRVRKALSMVIDRDIFVQHVLGSGELPLYGLMPKGIQGADVGTYDWATWPMAKRVDEAKKLLAAAGVPPGTTLHYATNPSSVNKKAAIFQASEWKTKLGLNTEIESLEFKVLLKRRHAAQYQISRDRWVADYNDASTFLALLRCGMDQNDTFSCNPKAEALIRQAAQSPDVATRQTLQTQAAALLMAAYPIVPLAQGTRSRLVKPYVGGYSYSLTDVFTSKDLYIIKH